MCAFAPVLAGIPACAQPQTTDLYDTPDRQVTVTVDLNTARGTIPKTLFGLNLSYFNDTDEIWAEHGIAESLAQAGVGALRYPGGEETSFYSWRHPGVNGYEDIHADPATHGMPLDRGPFQVTWTDPSEWETNESFMSFDEYMAHCKRIGAEPFVGINMSSGRAHDRIEDCLADAVALVRYSTEQWGSARDGGVRYWFLDNEPWHGKAAYTFDIEHEYVPDVVMYSRAIKAIDPEAEIIVNPFSGESYNFREFAVRVLRGMGDSIDHVDVHWYPGWGVNTWDRWASSPAMDTGTKWKPVEHHRPFAEDFALLREIFAEAGHPDLGLMALEWNIGPNGPLKPLSDTAFALMHAEILMAFIEGELEAACLWTNIWRSRREVWPEQDLFPALLDQQAPYSPTRSHDLFRMLSQTAGGTLVSARSDSPDLLAMAALRSDGAPYVALLNKSSLRRHVVLRLRSDKPFRGEMLTESFGVTRPGVIRESIGTHRETSDRLFVEPFSLTVLHGSSPPNPAATASARVVDAEWIRAAQDRVIQDIEAIDPASVHFVFAGDSITQEWLEIGDTAWNSLQDLVAEGPMLNLGVSGDRTEHLLHRLRPIERGGEGQLSAEGLRPDAVVLMIGTNNLFQHSSDQVVGGIRAVLEQATAVQPDAFIVLCTVLPTSDPDLNTRTVRPVNESIRSFSRGERTAILDLDETFALPNGGRDNTLFRDGLHLNAAGYEAWATALARLFEREGSSR